MSNLKLPTMTHANLSRMLGRANRSSVKLAYATEAMTTAGGVAVLHHSSIIAELREDGTIAVSTAGWDSQTTAGRIHKILVDNSTGYKCGIRQRETFLLNDKCEKVSPLSRATIKDGRIVEINGTRA